MKASGLRLLFCCDTCRGITLSSRNLIILDVVFGCLGCSLQDGVWGSCHGQFCNCSAHTRSVHRPCPSTCPWGLANSVLYPTAGHQAPTLGRQTTVTQPPSCPAWALGTAGVVEGRTRGRSWSAWLLAVCVCTCTCVHTSTR